MKLDEARAKCGGEWRVQQLVAGVAIAPADSMRISDRICDCNNMTQDRAALIVHEHNSYGELVDTLRTIERNAASDTSDFSDWVWVTVKEVRAKVETVEGIGE